MNGYECRFTDNVSKDGDSIKYTVNVRRLSVEGGTGEVVTLVREWEDLQYLDHQLAAAHPQPGLIYPSLPARPESGPGGSGAGQGNTVQGDHWARDTSRLQCYLAQVVSHPVLGASPVLTEFLETVAPPARPARLGRGWLAGVRGRWDARNTNARDSDEWFARERERATTYQARVRETAEKFSAAVAARQRLAGQLGHLAGALGITVAGNEVNT